MSLSFDGTDIKTINYNGTNLTKLIYNGVEVWTSQITVTYIYGGVSTEVIYNKGETITDYTPTDVSGRTFVGWTTSSTGTEAETLVAGEEDMILYGIGKVPGSASQSVSLRTIDRYEDDNFVGSYADTTFSVHGSVPLNTLVKVTTQYNTNGVNGISVGINVGGVGVYTSNNYQGGITSGSTTGKLENRNGFYTLSCNEGEVTISTSIYYSWDQIIVG